MLTAIYARVSTLRQENEETIENQLIRLGKLKESSKRLKPRSEWVEIPVPAIIDKELHERARRQLEF